MKQVIIDIETKKSFDQVGGYKPEDLGISFVGVIKRGGFEGKGEPLEFFESDLSKLWPVLETADVIVGFNTDGFDLPALKPYYPGRIEALPSLDLLARFKQAQGHRVSLDAIASETLGAKKSGSGLDALEYYATGQLDKLASYCMKDVAITRDIYDYGRSHGHIKFINKWNRPITANIDFSFNTKKGNGTQLTIGGI
jgi:DEAD/DEAH box helicase domain-containing protein